MACFLVEHFLANNQEHQRSPIDVVVDEQTLRMPLPPFATAVW